MVSGGVSQSGVPRPAAAPGDLEMQVLVLHSRPPESETDSESELLTGTHPSRRHRYSLKFENHSTNWEGSQSLATRRPGECNFTGATVSANFKNCNRHVKVFFFI